MADYQVVKVEDTSTYDGECALCGFQSIGWERKKDASERMDAHLAEHETGEPMPDMAEWLGYEVTEEEVEV